MSRPVAYMVQPPDAHALFFEDEAAAQEIAAVFGIGVTPLSPHVSPGERTYVYWISYVYVQGGAQGFGAMSTPWGSRIESHLEVVSIAEAWRVKCEFDSIVVMSIALLGEP